MYIRTCDRCDKRIEDEGYLVKAWKGLGDEPSAQDPAGLAKNSRWVMRRDLCSQCGEALADWIQMRPKVVSA